MSLRRPGSRHHAALDPRRWARVRRQVFHRDCYRCVKCRRAGRLECDHIVPLHEDPHQNPYDPDGCQTLCRSCHVAKTAKENRREPTAQERAWQELVAELAKIA